MIKIARLPVTAIFVLLIGCNTPYQESGFEGGVSAAAISKDVFRISANGNGYTDQPTIQDYVLLKAAEITLSKSGTQFMVLGSQNTTNTQVDQSPGTYNSNIIGDTINTT